MREKKNNLLFPLLEIIYPISCSVCGGWIDSDQRHICKECLNDIPLTYFWSWRDNPAEKKLWGRMYLQSVCSLYIYNRDNNYVNMIHRIKYDGDIALGYYLGSMLGKYMKEGGNGVYNEIDYLVPVPLHPIKKWKRGFNQSEIIAKGISDAMGGAALCTDVLKRGRYTSTQTKRGTESKWKNVENAFKIVKKNSYKLKGKHIIIVDDVLTSGATVQACYDALSKIENIKISLATLGYVE